MAQIDETQATPTPARAQELYFRNFGYLREVASSEPSLLVSDIDGILQGLARHLLEYHGPNDDAAFQTWACDIITPAVTRIATFYRIIRENTRIVRKAIWSVIKHCSDLGVHPQLTIESLETDVWLKVFLKLDDLLLPGTAKLGTRLYSMAKFEALGWRTERLRARKKFGPVSAFQRLEEDRESRQNKTAAPLIEQSPDDDHSDFPDVDESLEDSASAA